MQKVLLVTALLAADTALPAVMWDENDYILTAPLTYGFVVLNEDFTFKHFVRATDNQGYGSLDWFSNGDLLISMRASGRARPAAYYRYHKEGYAGPEIGHPYTHGWADSLFDVKAAPNDQGYYGAFWYPGTVWDRLPALEEWEIGYGFGGACAVVPRKDGASELWVGGDQDYGMRVYPLAEDGRIRALEGRAYFDIQNDASHTMTYDPASHRVLYPKGVETWAIHAVNAETKELERTYTMPDPSAPAYIEGVTAGENGIIVAVESIGSSFDNTLNPARSGFSVWDRDGSNYRFIDITHAGGTVNWDHGSIGPFNILWTGNSPEFRKMNMTPAVACPDSTDFECAPAGGASFDLTAIVTDADADQTLTVTLSEGATPLQQQVVATPASDTGVTFTGVVLSPGVHTLTVEVSDGNASSSCTTTITIQPDTPPTVVSSPTDLIIECPVTAVFGTPRFSDTCDASVTVSFHDSILPVSGNELSKTRRTWTATDDAELSVSISQTITVVDTAAPIITGVPDPISVNASSANGAVVNFTLPLASDACSGAFPVNCSPASGSLFPVGTTLVNCSAVDSFGHVSTATFEVTVNPQPAPISWSGILQPIDADGSSVFKAGRVVPVTFALTGASAGRTDLMVWLRYTKISGSTTGGVNEADAPGNETAGNQFDYDAATDQYYFNWSTKGLTAGTYRIFIDFGDGVERTANLGLR